MNVLVTGAGGMVGSHMVEQLYNAGHNVIGIWHKNKKNIEQITLPIRFVQCDLRYGYGLDELILDNLPDQIYHLAAQSYPTVSWASPAETIDVNINGTVALYEAIKRPVNMLILTMIRWLSWLVQAQNTVRLLISWRGRSLC